MYIISISHKTAPVTIRELFSFSKKEQEVFLHQVIQKGHISECVLLSTCNRTEVYFQGDEQAICRMQNHLADFKQEQIDKLKRYLLVYQGENAYRHLFQVACGMDSMVIGEDEILGQVKEAYDLSLKLGATKYLFNTLFQAAITCAKRMKTDTKLSKTPVSIGTLVANEVFQFPKSEKTVMIIGLTGKMGNIIMKNLYGKQSITLIGTYRTHNAIETDYKDITMIEYQSRYQYMDQADIIVSATTSPHYTVTCQELRDSIHLEKDRLFIDLSVPMDIDQEITKINKTILHDIDYYDQACMHNTLVKEHEIIQAQAIIDKHLDAVKKELIFHEFRSTLPKVSEVINQMSIENAIYEMRNQANSQELSVLLGLLTKLI